VVEHRIRNARVAGSNPAFGSIPARLTMTKPSVEDNAPPRRSRSRQREAMTNAVATVLGCMALVVMIATVVRVVMVKLWDSTNVNPEYVQAMYDSELERRWPGSAANPPASASLPPVPPPLPPPPAHTGSEMSVGRIPESAIPQNSASLPAALVTSSGIADIESKRVRIEATVRGFFEAAAVGDKLSFARDPERVGLLMAEYYATHPLEHHAWKGLGWILPVEEPGYRLGYAQAIFADAEPVSLIIEEMLDGSFRVDWESSVRYGELDWDVFIQTRPDSPKLFRVIASRPTLPPNSETPTGVEVLEIKHPDEDKVIYAYFDRQDPKFQSLIDQMQNGHWKDVPLTLRLSYPGPTSSVNGVSIASVEGKGWLILQGTRS